MKYVVSFIIGIVLLLIIDKYLVKPVETEHTQELELRKQVDSLQAELFIKQTQVGRYEIALELFKEEDSVAADHFEYILSTQTE
jgi:uncharacterized protein YlxW (UPF0749 family)